MTLLSPSSSSRRRGVFPVVLAVVLALAVGVAGGWYFAGRDKGVATGASASPSTTSTCTGTARPTSSAKTTSKATSKATATGTVTARPSSSLVAYPSPAAISVNVYNATTRKGLAKNTALEFTARGFHVTNIGNDPAKKIIAASAEVRFGPAGAAAAKVVAAQVPGSVLVPDHRKLASVDLVLGEGFTALASTADAAASISALASPTATGGC